MQCDIAIIGAGIVGNLAAYYALRKDKNIKILLCDQTLSSNGATQYSLGLDYPYGTTDLKREMAKESMLEWLALEVDISKLRRCIPLYGFVTVEDLPQVSKNILLQNIITSTESIEPLQSSVTMGPLKNQLLIKNMTCYYSQTRHVSIEILKYLMRSNHNISLCEGARLEKVVPTQEGIHLHFAEGNYFNAKKVIFAMGPWFVSSQFAKLFFPNLKLRTKKIVSLFIKHAPTDHDPAIIFFDHDAFLLPLIEMGRWVFSYTIYEWDCKVENTSWYITQKEREIGIQLLNIYAPYLVQKCYQGRVFCDAYSIDWTPIVESSLQHPSVVTCTGMSGSGFRLAPSIAKRALKLVGVL